MNLGVIGAGNIGRTLAEKWAQAGHRVLFGVRGRPDAARYDAVRSIGQVVAIGDAVAGAETVLLAVPGGAVADFAAAHGPTLAGKVVIDATNNLRSPELNNLAVLKEKAPRAKLVRAFSNLGWESFADPTIGGVAIDLFYCGRASARPVAEQLISEVGLRPVYLGDLDAVSLVDGMTRLWFKLAIYQGQRRRIGFKLLDET